MQDEQLKQIITETFTTLFDRLRSAGCTDHDFTNAFATVVAVAIDTLGENIGATHTMEIAVKVLERFCADKPNITLVTHKGSKPAKGDMQ